MISGLIPRLILTITSKHQMNPMRYNFHHLIYTQIKVFFSVLALFLDIALK